MQVHPVQAHPIRKLIQQPAAAAIPAHEAESKPLAGWSGLFFGFDGRLSREDFWCAGLALLLATGSAILLAGYMPGMAQDFTVGVIYAASIYPAAALIAKRLQDRNRGSFHLYLFAGFPVLFSLYNLVFPASVNVFAVLLSALYLPIMLWALIELCFLHGTPGANAYGDEPGAN